MCVKRVRTLNCHHKTLALYLMISTYVSHAKLKVATTLVALSALIVLLCYKCRQSVNLSSVIERQENDVVAQDLPERALASSRVKDGGSANHVLSGKVNNADVFKSRLVSPLIETRPQGGGGFVPQEMRMRFSSQLDEKFATARARAASDKNQLMDALLNQPELPADYGETMVSLCRDKSQDVLTRDFAVQHIGLYAQALSRRGAYNPKSTEAMSLRDALFDAAGETRTIVAAAAFRALSDMSAFDVHIDARRLDSMLAACAGDASAASAARAMVVQLCGERRVRSARPALERILASPNSPEILRRSASRALALLK